MILSHIFGYKTYIIQLCLELSLLIYFLTPFNVKLLKNKEFNVT